ncbi:hypothetical protein B9Z55_024011 [Caenorhabditis nigoni]|uniref:Uncharacterized protein n=1 Tax=Caenorhabditis nigoni TaxID=1611254 RepID=A0A2G5SS69_9PELO|nr:hypothetical protein B9Z55_024011 [Caenorhabditis nigoni]
MIVFMTLPNPAMITFIVLLLFTATASAGRSQRYYIVHPSDVEPVEKILDLEELNSQNIGTYVGAADGQPDSDQLALDFLARGVK